MLLRFLRSERSETPLSKSFYKKREVFHLFCNEESIILFPSKSYFSFGMFFLGPLYWPMFVVAILATIVASQAMISGTFSIIQQSLALGCFPRVKVVHTSAKYEGQVYIPELNYILMLSCVAVTVGFRTTENIGHAYGKLPKN